MHGNYKQNEFSLRNITKKYTTPVNKNKKIKLINYYKKFKTTNLIIDNSTARSKLQRTNIIYEFSCS